MMKSVGVALEKSLDGWRKVNNERGFARELFVRYFNKVKGFWSCFEGRFIDGV